jgi:hypothetical protein
VLDLAPFEQRVHRHDDAAEPQRPVVGDREVRDVRQHDADAVVDADAELAQPAGGARGGLVERSVVDLEVVELDRDVLGAAGGCISQ